MSKLIHISQPRLYPHISYLQKINAVDLYVVSNDLVPQKGKFELRNKYYNLQSKSARYLNAPILDKKQTFRKLSFSDIDFAKKHRDILRDNYKGNLNYSEELLNHLVPDAEFTSFQDYFYFVLLRTLRLLSIHTQVSFTSFVRHNKTGQERLEEIIKYFEADAYLSGQEGRKYITGIDVPVNYWENKRIEYRINDQNYYMILDTLFCLGLAETKRLIHG